MTAPCRLPEAMQAAQEEAWWGAASGPEYAALVAALGTPKHEVHGFGVAHYCPVNHGGVVPPCGCALERRPVGPCSVRVLHTCPEVLRLQRLQQAEAAWVASPAYQAYKSWESAALAAHRAKESEGQKVQNRRIKQALGIQGRARGMGAGDRW